jgi:aminoglycoside phosphotransferase (APT) family kinase protein
LSGEYVGHLPVHDPLYRYLKYDILPQIGVIQDRVDFRVFRIEDDRVYRYEEKHSGAQVIGKFFHSKGQDETKSASRMWREFQNLQLLRSQGLDKYPHEIVRHLGANASLNSLLVEEYREEIPLSTFIEGVLHLGRRAQLFRKLTSLAYFLATLHNRTANGYSVNFSQDCAYLDRLVRTLLAKKIIGNWEADEFYWLRDRWRERPRMWEDQQVLVHGDATPSNFLFGDNLSVFAIDLERMRRADRVFDLGRITGELQHLHLQSTGNKYAAEPFIGHFLWEYACHFPNRDAAFRSITGRLAFQMALTLLRIARNSWVSAAHRRRLVEEAKLTLRS